MAKTTWLCCERCGDIFEGTDGTQYCESCRNILYSNRKHALITCEICGKQFVGGAKSKNRYNGAIHYRPEPKKIPYKKPTTITEVVKAAAAMGLSYGDYVRRYGAK